MENQVVAEKHRDISIITDEILNLCKDARRTMLLYACEIGRRLVEAKEVLPHGEWGEWLKSSVGFSQSTANKHMQIFKSFGSTQVSLFGAELKSESFTNLSYTQALALLSVSDQEREEFIKDKNVEEMSTRELKKAIQERDAAKAEAEQAKADAAEKLKTVAELENRIAEEQKNAEKLKQTVEGNKKYVIEMQNKLEKAMSAENDAKKKLKIAEENPEIPYEVIERNKMEAEAEAAEKYAENIKKAVDAAKAEVEKAKQAAEQAEAETERLKAELAKKSAASNTKAVEFKTLFVSAQENMNKLMEIIDTADSELSEKLKSAMKCFLEKYLNEVG